MHEPIPDGISSDATLACWRDGPTDHRRARSAGLGASSVLTRGTPMQSLTQLANLYGSDKGTAGPSPWWPPHNYTDVYEAYLGHLRDQPLLLLEVGLGVPGDAWKAEIAQGRNTGGGASIKMWHDYFSKARIY